MHRRWPIVESLKGRVPVLNKTVVFLVLFASLTMTQAVAIRRWAYEVPVCKMR